MKDKGHSIKKGIVPDLHVVRSLNMSKECSQKHNKNPNITLHNMTSSYHLYVIVWLAHRNSSEY